MSYRETLNQLQSLQERATNKSMTSYDASLGIKQAIDLAGNLPRMKDLPMNIEFEALIKQYQEAQEYRVFTNSDLLYFCKTLIKKWEDYFKIKDKYENCF